MIGSFMTALFWAVVCSVVQNTVTWFRTNTQSLVPTVPFDYITASDRIVGDIRDME